MKANSISIDERYAEELKQQMFDSFSADINQALKDRETMAGCRAQWMLLVGEHKAHGRGKKYLSDVILGMGEILPSLIEDREADVMDEMLINDLERIGLNIRDTHKEYFEARERLKNFGKYVDKEKRRAEGEAKEKELLAKLNTNLFKKGFGKYV